MAKPAIVRETICGFVYRVQDVLEDCRYSAAYPTLEDAITAAIDDGLYIVSVIFAECRCDLN